MTAAIYAQLEQAVSKLSQPVLLLDRTGRCLIPKLPDVFMLPPQLKIDTAVSQSGYLFLALPGLEGLAICTKDKPGAADILYLFAQYVQASLRLLGITSEVSNALKRLLCGDISLYEINSLIHDHGIAERMPRVVLLLHAKGLKGTTISEILQETAPLGERDLLVGISDQVAALIRDKSQQEPEESLEFAQALQETLQNELGIPAQIGIGDSAPDLHGLPLSFQQAQRALELGQIFRPSRQVFLYQDLILERFMLEVSPETAMRYTSLLFNRKTSRLLSDEMLETVITFIRKNLNLSDAARELYIHRNTLVYRLDKIQKTIGLDVRHFQDAMVFKLLYDLRKREKIKFS